MFSDLIGKTITNIEGIFEDSRNIYIETDNGCYEMYHMQDCCEHVAVAKVFGDLHSVLYTPIIFASCEVVDKPEYANDVEPYDHHTFTEYTIITKTGVLKILWLGESNGWYDESVYFTQIHKRI